MAEIRGVRPEDLDDLYDICLRTGDSGADATALYASPRLLGDLFVVPYAVLEPAHAHVIDDGERVQGYAVGALDSRAFEARLEAEWLPAARERHAADVPRPGMEQLFLSLLDHPPVAHASVLERFPSHLHIDLLPSYQGGGWGRRMMEALFGSLRAAGSPGVHLGVSEANQRAIAFYDRLGFEQLHADGFTRTLGLPL